MLRQRGPQSGSGGRFPLPRPDNCGMIRPARFAPGVDKVRHVRRKLLWILVLTPILTGCQPIEDLGKLVDDLLKRFTG
jgi:hypothetical protein